MTPRARALAMTPGNAFLLACALGPFVVAAVWNAVERRDDIACWLWDRSN